MNKIFKVKRNSAGQSVVTSEIAKSRTKGRVIASALAVAVAGMMASGTASAAITVNQSTGVHQLLNSNISSHAGSIAVNDDMYKLLEEARALGPRGLDDFDSGASSYGSLPYSVKDDTKLSVAAITIGNTFLASQLQSDDKPYGNDGEHISIGNGARATNSISLGYFSQSAAQGAMALGDYSRVWDSKGIALGYGATSKNGGISIGAYSTSATAGTVSFGNGSLTRQLQNVTAGANDTDAVNVSQLKASTNEIVDILGGNAKVDPYINVTMTNIGGTGKNNIHDAIAAAMAGGNTTVVAAGDSIKVESATKDTTTTYTVSLDDATKQSITKAQIDATAAQTAVDALKPVVDKNTADIANLQANKADKADVDVKNAAQDAEIAKKANKSDLDALKTAIDGIKPVDISGKADKADVDAKNATQDAAITANTDAIKALDDKKADKSDLDALKDNITAGFKPELDKKADKADVDAKNAAQDVEIATKADKADVDAKNAAQDVEIATKADKADLDALNDAAVKYDGNDKSTVTLAGDGGTTITNVKDGAINATSQDAVNGRQLHATNTQVMKNTQSINQLNGRVNQLDGKINKVNKEARAGIAGAAAIAGLPQVRGNGKSMLAAAVGNYKGQNAIALGYTRSSDNGKLLLKLGGSANTQGDIVSSVGIGYEW